MIHQSKMALMVRVICMFLMLGGCSDNGTNKSDPENEIATDTNVGTDTGTDSNTDSSDTIDTTALPSDVGTDTSDTPDTLTGGGADTQEIPDQPADTGTYPSDTPDLPICSPDRWERITPMASQPITAIWGASESDVTLAAGNEIWHFAGTAWHQTLLDQPVNDLWGTASDNLYAVGNVGAIFHFDGQVWSTVVSPTDQNLTKVWGSSSENMFVRGDSDLFYFDGANWTTIEIAQNSSSSAVWASGPNDVYVYEFGQDCVFL